MSMGGKIALLFPGQGSQRPGMGKALDEQFPEARAIFDQANEALKRDFRSVIFNGTEEELKQTAVTQPAIYVASCAAFAAFQARFPTILTRTAFAAGHSLGEYSALFSAQVFDFQTGLKLVEYRGFNLQETCQKVPGTMAALIGFERDQLQTLCGEIPSGEICEMVNFNCPGQIVVAGTRAGVKALVEKAGTVPGTKAIPLNVSGPFHSSLLKEAAEKMRPALEKESLRDARIPVIANCDAKPTVSAAEIREKLVRQIDHPVRWEDSVKTMIDSGVETFIEIGPGRVLSGLLRKIDRKKTVLNIEDPDSLNKTLRELETSEVKTA